MLKIVRLKNKDIGKFRKLFVKMFKQGFSYYPKRAQAYNLRNWNRKKIEEKLETDNRLFLMALNNSLPAGFLIGKYYKTGTASILWIGVLEDFRHKGIASRLISRWERWAENKRAKVFRAATTNPDNEKFYTKLGYKKSPKVIKNDWRMALFVFLKRV